MSRKKKNKGGGVGALIVIFIFIIIAFTPIALFVGFLYYKAVVSSIMSNINKNYSDFWLRDEEKEEFKSLVNDYIQVKDIVDSAYEEVEKHNISINKDGSISRRSKLGKKLREIVDKYEPELYHLEERIWNFQILPQKRWKYFNNALRKYFSCKIALITWFVSVIIIGLFFGFSPIEVFKAYYKCAVFIFKQPAWKNNELEMLFIITGLSWISFFIGYFGKYKNIGEKYSPFPPEVDLENLNKY